MLAAVDSDVIKSYVELGLGVGIIAAMAFDPARDRGLARDRRRSSFRTNTTRIAVRRGAYLRGYVYDFIERFAPPARPARRSTGRWRERGRLRAVAGVDDRDDGELAKEPNRPRKGGAPA